MNLVAARRGYAYQQLVATAAIAESLGTGFGGAFVDRKRFVGDVFDDFEMSLSDRTIRVQIKSHTRQNRPLTLADLRDSGAFPLKNAFHSYAADADPADDYRLFATWESEQTVDDDAFAAGDFDRLLSLSNTVRVTLTPDRFWPPIGPRAEFSSLKDVGTREQFLSFLERFHIEASAPSASLKTSEPGPLELILYRILEDRLGIGLWPNNARSVEDAGAASIYCVTRADSRPDAWVDPSEFLSALSLTTDFGRVPERFPVDLRRAIGRDGQLDDLLDLAKSNSRVVVSGPPGAGKSWLLRGLQSKAQAAGWATALHFCYVDPLDASRRIRATVEATLGSLIAELSESCDYEHPADTPLYSARPQDLVAHVVAAAGACSAGRVLLIVDGLDHVSRVEPVALGLHTTSELLASALAGLELPAEVCLVVGSQPGAFLECLAGGVGWTVPPWDANDCAALLTRSELPVNAERIGGIARQLHLACGGNPLYLTYLTRELERIARQSGSMTTTIVARRLGELPAYDQGLSGYYTYLLDGVRTAVGSSQVVDLLGLVDFPLGETELSEVLPASRHMIPTALNGLSPVLSSSLTHGGVRIYHESFQRFIREDLEKRQADLSSILAPAISWLEARGFFADSRAFRSLIRTLVMAGRSAEAYRLCDHTFVAKAVAAGHGPHAVTVVLKDVAAAASRELRWDVLERVTELANAANTCFDDKLVDDEAIEFARTLAVVRDPTVIAERLIFDGRPDWGYRVGLLLCGFCDEAGATAPWEQYLVAYDNRDDHNTSYGDFSDELVEAAILRGRIRLTAPGKLLQRIIDTLNETENVRPAPITLGLTVARTLGIDALGEIIDAVKGPNKTRLLLAKAKYLHETEAAGVADVAQEALSHQPDDSGKWLAFTLGARSDSLSEVGDLLEATKHVTSDRAEFESDWVERWLFLVAHADQEGLSRVEPRLTGDGWYRCWLRYWTAMRRCDLANEPTTSAFVILEHDTRPFVGKPRTCDLYGIRNHIHDTIRIGLSSTTEQHWSDVLRLLVRVGRSTTTYLQNGPGGPLTMLPLLHMMLSQARSDSMARDAAELARSLVDEGSQECTYYETHAHMEMLKAQAEVRLGLNVQALLTIEKACEYLAAYGFHKDGTIFNLLGALTTLSCDVESGWVRARMSALQPHVEAVLTHTDGRGTGRALSTWHSMIAEIDPVGALRFFAEETRRLTFQFSEDVERDAPVAMGHLAQADEAHRLFGDLSLIFPSSEPSTAWPDSGGMAADVARRLLRAARESDPMLAVERGPSSDHSSREPIVLPAAQCTHDQLLQAIRSARWATVSDADWEYLAQTALEHLENASAKVEMVLQIAEASETEGQNKLLETLGDALLQRGHLEIAAACLVLAFTRSGDGWCQFGTSARLALIDKASEADAEMAKRIVADEVVDKAFARPGWSGITEQLPQLVMRIDGLPTAQSVWDEAAAVVTYRLPATGPRDRVLVAYAPSTDDAGSHANQAIAEFVLSRLQQVSLERRARALLASALLLAAPTHEDWAAVRDVLQVDMTVSASSLLLELIGFASSETKVPTDIVELLASAEASDLLCLRVPARRALAKQGISLMSPPVAVMPIRAVSHQGDDYPDAWVLAMDVWPDFPVRAANALAAIVEHEWVHGWMDVYVSAVAPPPDRRAWGLTWSPWREAETIASSRVAASVRAALATTGELSPSSEAEIARLLLPDTELRLRYQISRCERPSTLSLPSTSQDERRLSHVPVLREGSQFEGWVQLAHFEREWLAAEHFGDAAKQALAYSGVDFGAPHDSLMPFGRGVPSTWLAKQDGAWPRGFAGPVAGLGIETDLCGRMYLLNLHPKFVATLGLTPGQDHSLGLTLLDPDGEMAVRLRYWRHGFPRAEYLGQEIPELDGVELIARPDIFEAISSISSCEPTWRWCVSPMRSVEDGG